MDELETKLLYGFLGGLVVWFLNFVTNTLHNYRRNQSEAKYLGIRITCILEDYILQCANYSYADWYNVEMGRETMPPVPNLSEFPKDVNWSSIPAKLAFSTLSLANLIESYRNNISYEYEYNDQEAAMNTEKQYYALLGLRSLKIIQTIREKYSLEAIDRESEMRNEKRFKELEKEFHGIPAAN